MKKFSFRISRTNTYFIGAAALLFFSSFAVNFYQLRTDTFQHLHHSIQRYIRLQERDFEETVKDTALLSKLLTQTYEEPVLKSLVDKDYGLFIYEPDEYSFGNLTFWNNQGTIPTSGIVMSGDANGFVNLPAGQFVFMRREITLPDDKKLLAIGLIPVHRKYFMKISHLKEDFVQHPGAEDRVEIAQDSVGLAVKSSQNKTLFYLKEKPYKQQSTWMATALLILSITFLLVVLNNIANAIARTHGAFTGIAFLVGTVVGLRAGTYFYPDLLSLKQYGLFDPGIYGSGYILRSLGDLLINTLLVCWLTMFAKQNISRRPLRKTRAAWRRWLYIALAGFALVGITFGAADVIRSMITDATIPFTVTNFFNLNVYSVISFLILGGISFIYFFISELLLKALLNLFKYQKYYLYLLTATCGLMLLTLLQGFDAFRLNSYALIWLLIYIWLIQTKVFAGLFSRLNVPAVLFWLFVYSLSVSLIILSENRKKELEQRKSMAEKLSSQASPSSELLISIAFAYFTNDFTFPDFDRFKTASSNSFLKDSLTNKNFTVYLSKFDTKIYTFDAKETPLFNEEPGSYDTLNTIYQIEGKPTSINDVRYFEKSYDKYAYIFKKTVLDTTGATLGYFFVLSNPKQYKSDALIPELFRQNKEFFPEYSPDYSYAVYNNLALYDHYNNYEFPTHLKMEDVLQNRAVQNKNGYDLLWYKEGKDKIVIFAKKDNILLESVTLFAYLFSSFILLAALFRFFTLLINSRLRWKNIRQYWQLNIRSQIYVTIIFISLFSFW